MDDKNVKIGIIGVAGEGRPSRALSSLYMMGALASTFSEPMLRPVTKVCKRAAGNKTNIRTKCKHGGSCDGTRPRCRFAIY